MNTDAPQRFADWLAGRLKAAGLKRAFGVPGGGTSLDLLTALRGQGIDTVLTAREDAAVMMAGVSGRLANAPGLAFTTKGPGLASATNGLASAVLDRLPALLVAEAFEDSELGFLSHQVYDQAGLAASLLANGKAGVLGADAGAIDAWLAGGQTGLLGPAVMLPDAADMNRAAVPGADTPEKSKNIPDADIARAHKLLQASRRPVVVIGLEAARPGMSGPLREFFESLGAAVLCTYMAKGCVADNHPSYAGIFTGGAIEQACVGEADLIVLLGLDPVELIRKPWAYSAPVLDICEIVHNPHYITPAERLVGPLFNTLAAFGGMSLETTWTSDDISGHRNRFFQGMEIMAENGLSSSDVVRATAAVFDGVPRLAVDAGAHMFSACTFWPAREPLDVLISNGLATMAFAVPAVIAAALHDPTRGAVAMIGDGGMMMCLGELKTAVETKAKVCIIVFNDGCLSLIDLKRAERQLPDVGLSWECPDFAAIAEGFGLAAWRVDDGDKLRPALEAAAAENGPSLIDVRIDASGYPAQTKTLRG